MTLLSPPVLSAVTPGNGCGGFHFPNGLAVPGAADGSNPLYDRSLSAADRVAGAQRYFTKYCQGRAQEISLNLNNTSKEVALQDLKSVLQFVIELRNNGAEVIRKIDLPFEAKALMGANMVGADAKIFAGRDIGVVPPLPDGIVDMLKSRCELENNDKTVAETHRLVLIPASIDRVPTSINSLRKFAAEYGKGREPAFRSQDWYAGEAFANRPLAQSKWVLMYGTMAPNTGSKNDAEQIEAIKGYKQYETVGALEAIGTLVLGYLEHQRRDFSGAWCRTEVRASSGARVAVGYFSSGGLHVFDSVDRPRYSDVGRAVCRRIY